EVPQSYETTSPLCIIANVTTSHAAIQSRAVTLFFDPSNVEIHCYVARWYWDQQIHDWFGQHLRRLPSLEARSYVHASQDKQAGPDGAQRVLETHCDRSERAALIVQDLQDDPAYPTREDKATRFTELMAGVRGASRSTYFRIHRHLEAKGRLSVDG